MTPSHQPEFELRTARLAPVDQHQAHNTLAVIDPASRTAVAEAEFPTAATATGR